MFERFYRLDRSRTRHTGGAGLGLAIAREVLAMFKGTIRIEQSSAEGTTIAVRLPGVRQRPTSSAAQSRVAPLTRSATLH